MTMMSEIECIGWACGLASLMLAVDPVLRYWSRRESITALAQKYDEIGAQHGRKPEPWHEVWSWSALTVDEWGESV